MVFAEMERRFGVNSQRLEEIYRNHLIQGWNGEELPTNEQIHQLSLIETLLDAGLSMDKVKLYLRLRERGDAGRTDRVRVLRQQRCTLLQTIHKYQKSLDEIDFLIYEDQKK